ncbi:hypothetical protein YC2023_105873 [Brassica napus]
MRCELEKKSLFMPMKKSQSRLSQRLLMTFFTLTHFLYNIESLRMESRLGISVIVSKLSEILKYYRQSCSLWLFTTERVCPSRMSFSYMQKRLSIQVFWGKFHRAIIICETMLQVAVEEHYITSTRTRSAMICSKNIFLVLLCNGCITSRYVRILKGTVILPRDSDVPSNLLTYLLLMPPLQNSNKLFRTKHRTRTTEHKI